jgi:hypothetical protein
MDVLGLAVVLMLAFPRAFGAPLLAGLVKAFKREMEKKDG